MLDDYRLSGERRRGWLRIRRAAVGRRGQFLSVDDGRVIGARAGGSGSHTGRDSRELHLEGPSARGARRCRLGRPEYARTAGFSSRRVLCTPETSRSILSTLGALSLSWTHHHPHLPPMREGV